MDTKLMSAEPFVRAPASGPALNVLGVTHIYKAMGDDTAGSFSLWEAVVPPGAGAPPHTHGREDESFYVLSGELVMELEGEPAPCRIGPGGFFFGARGRRHAFRNIGDQPARALILCTPSVGLDRMFAELDAATAKGITEIGTLAAIAARFGVTVESPAA
ncbi:MAG TPA: cupin domain-containing protein [Dongiaceae bacterium]|nr:cupin domain-containing protein [Dongiaceae bacterium]